MPTLFDHLAGPGCPWGKGVPTVSYLRARPTPSRLKWELQPARGLRVTRTPPPAKVGPGLR